MNTPASPPPPPSKPVTPHAGAPRAIATPCVMVCTVDGASGLCLGCLRSLTEIASWSRMTDDARAAVMRDLSERRQRLDPALRGD